MYKRLIVIDGNSLLFRAYYGTMYTKSGILTNSQGVPINALLTFTRMILNLISDYQPSHLLVAFDTGKKTFRHEAFGDYKGKRTKAPDELHQQFPLAKEMLDSLNVKHFELVGFEADDIIATLAFNGQDAFQDILAVSSDKDLYQIVSPKISLIIPQNGAKKNRELNFCNFVSELGIHPNQVVDFKGLVGDASDNLPGVKGIGDKGAVKLLQEYHSLENLYVCIDQVSLKLREKLIASKEMALMSKSLATLNYDVKIPFSWTELEYIANHRQSMLNFFKKYELFSLLKKYQNEF